jgi:hypothetical protein
VHCVCGGEQLLLQPLLQGERASSRLAREVRGTGPVGEGEGTRTGQWEEGRGRGTEGEGAPPGCW